MFEGFRPADFWMLLVEFVVLWLILREQVYKSLHERKVNRLTGLLLRAENLTRTLYSGERSPEADVDLTRQIQEWQSAAAVLVGKLPAYARDLFQRDQGISVPDPCLRSPEMTGLIHAFINQHQAIQRILGDRFTAGML